MSSPAQTSALADLPATVKMPGTYIKWERRKQ